MPTSNKQRKPRSPVKLKPITDERKLVSRKEAARILGFHPDSLKKLEDHHGGPLKVIRADRADRQCVLSARPNLRTDSLKQNQNEKAHRGSQP